MKIHLRLLYAAAVVVLIAAGIALKADNDARAAAVSQRTAAVHPGSTP